MRTYFCVYLGATFLALLTTPVVARIGRAMRILDAPDARKVHSSPTPRIGGLAIALPAIAMSISVLVLDNVIGQAFRLVRTHVIVLLATGVFVFVVGLVDDVRGLSARTKLLGQALAAAVVCGFGIRIGSVTVGQWFSLDFGWWAWPITMLWIIGITNAVNLIDGLDGLAAGISAVVCGVIAIFAIYTGQPVMAVLVLALLGSLSGFLIFNFHPAKTFMGDCGSMFLGFVIATASVMCALKSATLAGLALPFLALGVPIFDAFFSILRRIVQRRSIFAPDRSHIHHRLLAGGLRQRRAVILMYVVTLIAGGLGTFMMVARGRDALVVFGCVFVLLVLVFRAAGAIGLGGSIAALRRNLAVAREAGQEKRHLEEAQLRLCGATTLDAWWQSMCATAEKMGFASLSVSVVYPEGPTRRLFWRPGPPGPPASRGVIHLVGTLPDDPPGLSVRIEADIPVDGSLESAGRRAALFGRLIDEQSLNELAPGQRAA